MLRERRHQIQEDVQSCVRAARTDKGRQLAVLCGSLSLFPDMVSS